MSEVPVSTIPAVLVIMVVEPYAMDWSMPKYLEAGNVCVRGLVYEAHVHSLSD